MAKKVLDPARLTDMLSACARVGAEREGALRQRLSKLRQGHKDAEAGIARLLELVEKGVMDAEDPGLRERLVGLKVRRDTLAKETSELQRQVSAGTPQIAPEKIERLTRMLHDKLHHGPADLRQAYTRLVMDEVLVTDEEIHISGLKATLPRCATEDEIPAAPAVLSFVQEWRARRDSNSRPLDS